MRDWLAQVGGDLRRGRGCSNYATLPNVYRAITRADCYRSYLHLMLSRRAHQEPIRVVFVGAHFSLVPFERTYIVSTTLAVAFRVDLRLTLPDGC